MSILLIFFETLRRYLIDTQIDTPNVIEQFSENIKKQKSTQSRNFVLWRNAIEWKNQLFLLEYFRYFVKVNYIQQCFLYNFYEHIFQPATINNFKISVLHSIIYRYSIFPSCYRFKVIQFDDHALAWRIYEYYFPFFSKLLKPNIGGFPLYLSHDLYDFYLLSRKL